MIYTSEKALADAGDKIPEDTKKLITDAMEELKKAKEADDVEQLQTKTEALSNEMMKIGEILSKSESEKAKAPGGQEAPKESEDNIRDAEFKESDDEDGGDSKDSKEQ